MTTDSTSETEREASRHPGDGARTHLNDCKCKRCLSPEQSQSQSHEEDTVTDTDSDTQEILSSVLFTCPFCGQRQRGEVTLPVVSRPRHNCSGCETRYPIARPQLQSYHIPHTTDAVKSEVSTYMNNLQNIRAFGRNDDRQWPLLMRYGAIAHVYTVPLYFILVLFGFGSFALLPGVAGIALLSFLITSKSLSKKLEHESDRDVSFNVTDTVQWKTYLKGRQEAHGVPAFISNNIPETDPTELRKRSKAVQTAEQLDPSDNT